MEGGRCQSTEPNGAEGCKAQLRVGSASQRPLGGRRVWAAPAEPRRLYGAARGAGPRAPVRASALRTEGHWE